MALEHHCCLHMYVQLISAGVGIKVRSIYFSTESFKSVSSCSRHGLENVSLSVFISHKISVFRVHLIPYFSVQHKNPSTVLESFLEFSSSPLLGK